MAVYDVDGNVISEGGSGGASAKDTRSVLHMGWHTATIGANSKSAFVEAYNRGFTFAEADITPTTDNVLVMQHETVTTTYTEWKGSSTEKLSFDEFLLLVKKLNLHIYLDGKAGAQDQLQTIYNKIMGYDMLENFTFFGTVKGISSIDSNARVIYDLASLNNVDVSTYPSGCTFYVNYVNITSSDAQRAIASGRKIELYTLSTTGNFLNCFNNVPMATRWCTDNISVDDVLANNV